jgi:serine/threonine-protein kinase
MVDVAQALAHAHARGIVHKDVKPSNLLVGAGDHVKVLDFGLAERRVQVEKAEAAPTASTLDDDAGTTGGTLGYMAPEQAMGYEVDGRADVFAFGVVLYQLLAGRPPFEGKTSWELVAAVLHREPPPLVVEGGDPRGPALARFVSRLLAKRPEARPGDFLEIAAELDRLRSLPAAERVAAAVPASFALAVTGFENLTGDPADDWIGVGLRETVGADLARLERIELLARDRVDEARRRLEQGATAEAVHATDTALLRVLQARYLVGGAVQRFGETVRLTLRFVDAVPGGGSESFRFDGRLDEIFALQDRVVAELTRRIASGRSGPAASPEAETTVVAAYEALSRGLLNVRTETHEGLSRAILFFERAVALDPRYAKAHLELGIALGQQGEYLVSDELKERGLAAISVARRLHPEWTRAQRESGSILLALNRTDEAIELLVRALEAAPEEGTLLATLARAHFLGRGDFATAASLFDRAVGASPHSGWYWLQHAHCRTLLGELALAKRAAVRAVELQEKLLSGREDAQIVGAHMRLGHVMTREGRTREAVEQYQLETAFVARVDHALRNRIAIELHLRHGVALAAMEKGSEAASHFHAGLEGWQRRLALGADEPFTRYYAAALHAQLGEEERAVATLERAAAERPQLTLARARREPEFERLHTHPRFQALLARYPLDKAPPPPVDA